MIYGEGGTVLFDTVPWRNCSGLEGFPKMAARRAMVLA
jgi:hypothetical protein